MSKRSTQKEKEIYIIGVGASAGGLKALKALVSSFIEKNSNFSLFVVQHMASSHKSELASILKKFIPNWDVEEITGEVSPKRNTIYVAPSDSTIIFDNKIAKLSKSERGIHPSPNVDQFLISLAENYKSNAIGIILSGTGNDGSEGLLHIKAKGGLTISQIPSTAENPEMPRNASEYSDYQLAPESMFYEITQYIDNHGILKNSEEQEETEERVDSIFALLHKKTGTNFAKYKSNTLNRRINKRVDALNLQNVEKYTSHIRANPAELDILFETVLIGVTEFFRDEKMYKYFKDQLKKVLKNKQTGDSIRIWSVGCATGEEPYSIAIILADILGDDLKEFNIQIFATDIDEKALRKARIGFYTKDALENLSKEQLENYFIESDHGYQVKKDLRQMILFSKHDITVDPPFVKLDAITCRNLLIYFKNELQKEALKVFHYSLKDHGFLFLGKSESISGLSDLFQEVEKAKKVYTRLEGSPINTIHVSRFRRRNQDKKADEVKSEEKASRLSLTEHAKETLFHTINEDPYVIINDQHQIKEVRGSLKLFLELSEGKMDANIFKMLHKDLMMELRYLLAKFSKNVKLYKSKIIKINVLDHDYYVRLKVAPLFYGNVLRDHIMIVFEKIDVDPKYISFEETYSEDEIDDLRFEELEQELIAAQEHIQTFTEELETSNEELQSLNEELQSANEELKSANEELETSNEELQSTNEELQTSNTELRNANDEALRKEKQLTKAKQDLEQQELLYKTITNNFPNGTIGIVDKKHMITFLAGEGLDRYGMKPDELIGTKPYDLNKGAEKKRLKTAFTRALKGEKVHLTFSFNDSQYLLNLMPLEKENEVTNVMFVTQNISEHSQLVYELEESEQRFKNMADKAPVMIWMSDESKSCIYFNKTWLNFTGRKLEDELGDGWVEGVHPDDREQCMMEFHQNFDKKKEFSIQYRLKSAEGEYHYIMDNGVPRYDGAGNFIGYIGGCVDINEQKLAERKKDEFLNIASHELNTPLTSAKVYVDLIFEEMEDLNQENEPIKKYSGKIRNSLDKLSALITELLEVSRIELNKQTFRKEVIEFDSFVKGFAEDYQRTLDRHELVVRNKSNKEIIGDPDQLEQVMANLISNAVKYAPKTDKIEIKLDSIDHQAVLEVKDNGIGISEDDLPHIFDRFYQVNTTNYRKGLGLGLFLCKQIVERHNGVIEVDSKKGKGTTFTVILPQKK